MIGNIFPEFFDTYKQLNDKNNLRYVVTSTDRQGDPKTNPHAIPGNAMDFTLRTGADYSGLHEYNLLFAYMFDNWQYRAGIDNTEGNIHIHIDLGQTKITDMPYFFKEDSGVFKYQIVKKSQI